jgi:hypothetical protein
MAKAEKGMESGAMDLEVMVDRCSLKDMIYLANRMHEFLQTEHYKILKLANWKQIRMLLASGKLQTETAEYRLGFMEGVMNGFETRLAELIDAGRKAEEQIAMSDDDEDPVTSLSGAEDKATDPDPKEL